MSKCKDENEIRTKKIDMVISFTHFILVMNNEDNLDKILLNLCNALLVNYVKYHKYIYTFALKYPFLS